MAAKVQQQKLLQQVKAEHLRNWTNSWKVYQNCIIDEPLISQAAPLDKKRLKIYASLKKAESAVTTQIQTRKMSLADFLYKHHVPGFLSPACPCGWYQQTPEHVIMHCQLMSNRRIMFCNVGTRDYQKLTESSKPLKILTAWFMKSGILTQFLLAIQLLYQ